MCSSFDLKQSKWPETTDCLLKHMLYHYCSNSRLSTVDPLKFETVVSILQLYKTYFFRLKEQLVMELVICFGAHVKYFIFPPKILWQLISLYGKHDSVLLAPFCAVQLTQVKCVKQENIGVIKDPLLVLYIL